MATVISKSCDYGLRAALFVASQDMKKYVTIKEISDSLDISFHFLTKILQKLTNEKIMISYRGPNGGVALAKPAKDITLEEIVIALDGPDLFRKCVLGLMNCDDKFPCPVHFQWKEIRQKIQMLFQTTNLQELAEKINKDGFRLRDYQIS